MFIALEGVPGSGKTTQATRLANYLRAVAGRDVLHLSFPSDSPTGVVAKRILRTGLASPDAPAILHSVMLADRCGCVGAIQECLRHGGSVVVEWWTASSLVYGGVDGLDESWIAVAQAALPAADLTVLVDVDAAAACARLGQPGRGQERYDTIHVQKDAVRRYRKLWASLPRPGWAAYEVVDGQRPPDEVWSELLIHVVDG